MTEKGILCISLDFELHWGVFDKRPLASSKEYFENTRQNIEKLLAIFEDHSIHVTWATVGALGAVTRRETEQSLMEIDARYHNKAYEPDSLCKQGLLGDNEQTDPYHFARELILKVAQTPGQELGSHTYSHFYTLEPGSNLNAFRKDLENANRALSINQQSIVSLVFPRNQYSAEHLKVAHEAGILTARSNPQDWFWATQVQSAEPLKKKLIRTIDHYFSLSKDTTYALSELEVSEGVPVLQPASRFLRPPSIIDKFLGKRKVSRIKNEMTHAAKKGRVYHLWWHPHNFSVKSEQSFSELDQIIRHFNHLRGKYGFESKTMKEIFEQVTHEPA